MLQKKGICLALMNDYRRALNAHTDALQIYKRIHGSSHMSVKNSLFNTALCLNALQRPAKARECLNQAYKITKKELGDDNMEAADIQFHVGISYKLEKDYKAAKKCFDDTIHLRRLHSKYECPNTAEIFEMVGDAVSSSGGCNYCFVFQLDNAHLLCWINRPSRTRKCYLWIQQKSTIQRACGYSAFSAVTGKLHHYTTSWLTFMS